MNCTFDGDFGNEGAITIQTNKNVNHIVNVKGCTFNNIPATSHRIFLAQSTAGLFYDFTLNTDLQVSSDYEIENFIKLGSENIYLPAGTYEMPDNTLFSEGVTLVCEEGTVFEGGSSLNINGATVIGATFSNPSGNAVGGTINGTFKDCTFTGKNALRYTYAGETVVFENCVFSGDTYGVHFDAGEHDVIFRNCTISGFNGLGAALTMVTFEGCTFVGNGKSGYNGANLWGSAKMINCEFTFDGSTATEWIDCINNGGNKTYEFTNCTVNGVPYTKDNFETLNKIQSSGNAKVKINGVDCQL